MTAPPIVTVELFSPYPDFAAKARLQINPLVTAVSVRYQVPYGLYDGTVGLLPADFSGPVPSIYPSLPEPVMAKGGDHVIVMAGGTEHPGVVTYVAPDGTGFTFSGYGPWATRYGHIDRGGDTQVTAAVIVLEALRSVPWLTAGQIDDTGVLHAWSEVQDRKASDVILQLAEEGGVRPGSSDPTDRVPWMFVVDNNRVARFTAMNVPSVPDYSLSYDRRSMQIGWNDDDVIDGVAIVYTGTDSVRRREPPTGWFYAGRFDQNGTRPARTETLSGSASDSGAVAVARTTLAQRSRPTISGTLHYDNWDGIGIVAPQSFELLGYGGAETGGYNGGFFTDVSHDFLAGTTQVTLGQPARSTLPGFLRDVQRTVVAVAGKSDFVTGART